MDNQTTLLQKLNKNGIHAQQVLRTIPLLQNQWEMDGEAWIVELSTGETKIYTTNHGKLCPWTPTAIQEYKDSLQSHLHLLEECLSSLPQKAP
jgi:hypothetical protein